MRPRILGMASFLLLMGALVVLAIGVSSCGQSSPAASPVAKTAVEKTKEMEPSLPSISALEIKSYSAAQVKAFLDRQDALTIVNVDPAVYYEAGRIKGAVSLPLDEIEERYTELEPDRLVILYCG